MIEPWLVAEVRRRTSLAELIGAEVALRPAGRELAGLCPFHTERSASFYVVEAKGFWHCFGCRESGDCFGWVLKTRVAADFHQAVMYLAARCGLSPEQVALEQRPIARRPAAAVAAAAEAGRRALARQIWHEALPAAGSPAESYLRRARRLRLPLPPTIRYHPALPHPFQPRQGPLARLRWPAMVAAFSGADRTVAAVHCTYLSPRAGGGFVKAAAPAEWPAARDWKAKIVRGSPRGAAIRLTPAQEVVVLGEGIETSASVLQALWDWELGCAHSDGEPVAVYAAGSLIALGTVELPPQVREVILAADSDGKIPDAGEPERKDPEAVMLAAAAKHRAAGRNVRIARPPAGTDFNDLLPQGVGIDIDDAAELAA